MRGWREPLLLSLVKALLTPSPQVKEDPRVPGQSNVLRLSGSTAPVSYDSDDDGFTRMVGEDAELSDSASIENACHLRLILPGTAFVRMAQEVGLPVPGLATGIENHRQVSWRPQPKPSHGW